METNPARSRHKRKPGLGSSTVCAHLKATWPVDTTGDANSVIRLAMLLETKPTTGDNMWDVLRIIYATGPALAEDSWLEEATDFQSGGSVCKLRRHLAGWSTGGETRGAARLSDMAWGHALYLAQLCRW